MTFYTSGFVCFYHCYYKRKQSGMSTGTLSWSLNKCEGLTRGKRQNLNAKINFHIFKAHMTFVLPGNIYSYTEDPFTNPKNSPIPSGGANPASQI